MNKWRWMSFILAKDMSIKSLFILLKRGMVDRKFQTKRTKQTEVVSVTQVYGGDLAQNQKRFRNERQTARPFDSFVTEQNGCKVSHGKLQHACGDVNMWSYGFGAQSYKHLWMKTNQESGRTIKRHQLLQLKPAARAHWHISLWS